MNEARLRASLDHPSIASIYDYGVTDGRLYLVMEPIQGMSIAEVLHRRGKFPPAEAIGILAQIAEVLDFVHAHSVFYGDLNPENIFISPDGMVRILDSGIAPSSLLDNLEGNTAERLIGTPSYMAPEISLEGKKVSPASDVYSLGAIAYEILTGRLPFDGSPIEVASAHYHGKPVPKPSVLNPTLNNRVDKVLLRALAKDPVERFSSASDFVDSLKKSVEKSAATKYPMWFVVSVFLFTILAGLLLPLLGSPSDIVDPPVTVTPSTISPTPVASLSSLEVNSEYQPDGTFKRISRLSLNSLGVGNLLLSAPAEMNLEDSEIVILTLELDNAFAGLLKTEEALPEEAAFSALSQPNRYTDRIDIYPVMLAELQGTNFEVESNEQPLKVIVSDTSAQWTWSVKAKSEGKHSLLLSVSIPVLVDGSEEILSHTLTTVPLEIVVKKSLGTRLEEILPWLSAPILGLLGVLITVRINNISRDRERKIEKLENTVTRNQFEKEQLNKEIDRLKSIPAWKFWGR